MKKNTIVIPNKTMFYKLCILIMISAMVILMITRNIDYMSFVDLVNIIKGFYNPLSTNMKITPTVNTAPPTLNLAPNS